ncbi:MAG: 2,3,4,5-tetrahydropyridine-2-carboxylate N-succinyltransferase [Chlamydiales bacterium]
MDLENLLDDLEHGRLRAAECVDGEWIVHSHVKEAILELFRSSEVVAQSFESSSALDSPLFFDKRPLEVRRFAKADGVRMVPGGSAVRRGAYLAPGVVCMPPMYVNIGAWVGAGTMIDSHALVGSCAQIGEGVHISAGCQIGGVLEPVGARPVIVEDGAFLGGNTGIYDGFRIGTRAVIAAGLVITGATPVFDLVHGRELARDAQGLEIPAGAVVVPGTRPARGDYASAQGLQAGCALIVKYRDGSTDAATALEGALR